MLVLGWVLATGCSSQEQPNQLPPTNISGNSGGAGGGGSAGSGGTTASDSGVAVADAGSATSDESFCDPVPVRLLPQRDDAAVYACAFALTIPSNGYDEIRVFEDGSLMVQIPASASDGWTYSDASTIALTGSYCDDALAGKFVSLYVIFSCHEGPIP